MTFDDLVQRERGNAWLDEPGFASLYVGIGPRCIGLERGYRWMICLANFEVINKGEGVFTRFVAKIEQYQLPILIENVLNDRFARFLPKLGFVQVEDMVPPCFLKDWPGSLTG